MTIERIISSNEKEFLQLSTNVAHKLRTQYSHKEDPRATFAVIASPSATFERYLECDSNQSWRLVIERHPDPDCIGVYPLPDFGSILNAYAQHLVDPCESAQLDKERIERQLLEHIKAGKDNLDY